LEAGVVDLVERLTVDARSHGYNLDVSEEDRCGRLGC
jgi:hypothetical protein